MNPSPKIFLFLYAFILLLSLFIVIPMVVYVDKFDGNCMLYATGTFQMEKQVVMFNLTHWGKSSNCNFILYMGITTLVSSAVFTFQSVLFLWKEIDRAPFSAFVLFVSNSIITFCMFVASLIATVGYRKWCQGFFNLDLHADLQCTDIDLSNLDKTWHVNSDSFFTNISITEFGLWSSFCLWCTTVFFSFLKIRFYHKNDDLLQSLAYEKQNLLRRQVRYNPVESHSTI